MSYNKQYESYQKHLAKTAEELTQVSPTYCVAKWSQVTMHLQNGHNHSCHHPQTHYVSVDEIRQNPTALHNSNYKKQQRKLMLEGSRPSECDYCWRVEDAGHDYSDRIYKSADSWSHPLLNTYAQKSWDADVDPTYVEVSFSNTCNFKCSYCAPHISSMWMDEITRWGPYPTTHKYNNIEWIAQQNQMPIPNNEDNPYVDAFWQWWPHMYKNLHHFRITGGEPLLNKNTFRVLEYIIENPNPNLEVSVNTNMNPPPQVFEKFLSLVEVIVSNRLLKNFKLFTSAEAHGRASEYIRWGMNYSDWLKNIQTTYERVPGIQFTIMSTYNALSVGSYIKFLDDILQLKREWGGSAGDRSALLLDIPYLRHPEHQSVFILEPDMLDYITDSVTHMYKNLENKNWALTAHRGFYEHEADKLVRIYNLVKNNVHNEWTNVNRRDFVTFVDEHDKRRGSNFRETFPEWQTTYERWQNAYS